MKFLHFCSVSACASQDHCASWPYPSSGILNNWKIQRFRNFPSSGHGRETYSVGSHRWCVSLLSPEDRNGYSSRNVAFSSYLEFRTMGKVRKRSNFNFNVSYRQNPLHFACLIVFPFVWTFWVLRGLVGWSLKPTAHFRFMLLSLMCKLFFLFCLRFSLLRKEPSLWPLDLSFWGSKQVSKVPNAYRGVQKMYSPFDSQYLWNKVTCSYNSSVVL
jgi:hypothetical protein